MRSREIEDWVLQVAQRVTNRQPVEDDRVELKREWIEPYDAARRIAGHANASLGERVLWIVGIDEDEGVTGASAEEVSGWYARVQKQFDGIAPGLQHVNVPVGGLTVVALLFETGRAPFVVRNARFGNKEAGPVEREVPWREGTRVRSATRADLIRLMEHTGIEPELEVLSASLEVTGSENLPGGWALANWEMTAKLYVIPRNDARIIIPWHRCKVAVSSPWSQTGLLTGTRTATTRIATGTVVVTPNDALIAGPGILEVSADGIAETCPDDLEDDFARVTITLAPANMGGIRVDLRLEGRPERPIRRESRTGVTAL